MLQKEENPEPKAEASGSLTVKGLVKEELAKETEKEYAGTSRKFSSSVRDLCEKKVILSSYAEK